MFTVIQSNANIIEDIIVIRLILLF